MQRYLITILTLGFLLSFATSCSSKNEEEIDDSNRNGNSSGGSTQGSGLSTDSTSNLSDTENLAKQVALRHAGVAEAGTQGLNVELDESSGVGQYNVTFWVNTIEYKVAILASDSSVISFFTVFHETGYEPPTQEELAGTEFTPEAGNISATDAQNIVLGLSGEALELLENYSIVQGNSGDFPIYTISFLSPTASYLYVLMANTGQVMSATVVPIELPEDPSQVPVIPDMEIPETPGTVVPEQPTTPEPSVTVPAPEAVAPAPEVSVPEPTPPVEEFASSAAPSLG